MNVGIIGRSEWTYDSMVLLKNEGHNISFIVTSKEAPEYKYISDDFKDFAIKNNIPFLHDPKISAEKIINLFQNNKTQICVSVNYSGVISNKVIDLFPLGILNAHGGDLPRYRGNACQAWALINGEKNIGLCIHQMIGGELDSGDIIARSFLAININTRIEKVYRWMDKEIPKLVLDSIDKLSLNPKFILESQSQEPTMALRCYPRLPEDGKINWNHSGEKIVKIINASSEPFMGAFCEYKGLLMKVWRGQLFEDKESYCGFPGQVSIINKTEGFIVVITGKGKIKISEIEFEGKRTSPDKIIKSIRTRLK